ncbi:MAG: serine/threonine protein kinase, partial [Sandaracinaceae bacterium]|nr:serine/threonine protein kinase [Sandaracinaceae bacterium]
MSADPMGGPEREEDEAQTLGASQPFATTAIGPADVRDTPNVKPGFAEPIEDEDDDDDDEPDPWIGRTLSNLYQLEERIGEGGMGTVYVARHVHLEKRFAVKVLNEAAIHKNNAVERLKQEAVAASSIDHENIVDVVNFDRTEDGAVYIVMELLKGESLAERLGRGPIDLHRALPITYQICRALHAAHERGIVHRDLKPENVFLTDKGERQLVKVLDFGISKIKSADAEQVRMTKTGQLVGTPLYMSPEQARGEGDVDRRVDVYAMGVILYEMVTGAPPFEGRNYFELLWKHGNEPPLPIGERNPNVFVPEAIEQVLLRSLSKRREDRYQTMLELEQALLSAAPDVPALGRQRGQRG